MCGAHGVCNLDAGGCICKKGYDGPFCDLVQVYHGPIGCAKGAKSGQVGMYKVEFKYPVSTAIVRVRSTKQISNLAVSTMSLAVSTTPPYPPGCNSEDVTTYRGQPGTVFYFNILYCQLDIENPCNNTLEVFIDSHSDSLSISLFGVADLGSCPPSYPNCATVDSSSAGLSSSSSPSKEDDWGAFDRLVVFLLLMGVLFCITLICLLFVLVLGLLAYCAVYSVIFVQNQRRWKPKWWGESQKELETYTTLSDDGDEGLMERMLPHESNASEDELQGLF